MLDRSRIGYAFAERQLTVDPGLLRLFAAAIGIADLSAPQLSPPGAETAIPLTYGFCLDQMVPSGWEKTLGIDVDKMLHAQQSFIYFRSVPVGATVTLQSHIADMYEKKNGALEFVMLHTDLRCGGELCVSMDTLVVQRNA